MFRKCEGRGESRADSINNVTGMRILNTDKVINSCQGHSINELWSNSIYVGTHRDLYILMDQLAKESEGVGTKLVEFRQGEFVVNVLPKIRTIIKIHR